MSRWQSFPCACKFAKSVRDNNPTHFPRVGIADNVLYRGHWIIRHSESGREAVIVRSGEPALHAEADACCFEYFIDEREEALIARNQDEDISTQALSAIRTATQVGLGFNCAFVDDDVHVLVGLAQRAVLAGLASDLSDDMQARMISASEACRSDHEKALGRTITKQ